eukprot:c27103_g1_i1 orf=199-1623(+)
MFGSLEVAMSFWTCSKCTFVNQSQVGSCSVCLQRRCLSVPERNVVSGVSELKWGCRACTFLNKSEDVSCDICGTPKSSVSLSAFAENDPVVDEGPPEGTAFWPLRSCKKDDLQIRDDKGDCEAFKDKGVCSASTSSVDIGLAARSNKRKTQDGGGSSGPLSNSMLGKLHLERISRTKSAESVSIKEGESTSQESRNLSSLIEPKQSIVILTYNVWFREDVEVLARMNAIGDIIQQHKPHFICFQEVTPNIYEIFQQSAWWREYQCSITSALAAKRAYFCIQLSRIPNTKFRRRPFQNSIMGRELCITEVDFGKLHLVVATSHLESPCPAPPTWDQMFSKERVSQADEALKLLKDWPNVVFGGDMNWNEKLDGTVPLPKGWCDAWLKLRPAQDGFTYDCKANLMLGGGHLRSRLDRFFYYLQDFDLEGIEMLGTSPIPGISYQKEKTVRKVVQKMTLPVLASDHFGLLLQICPKF